MKTKDEIDFIYEKLSELYPNYSNKKPKAKKSPKGKKVKMYFF